LRELGLGAQASSDERAPPVRLPESRAQLFQGGGSGEARKIGVRSAQTYAHGFELHFGDHTVLGLLRQKSGTHDALRRHDALSRVQITMVKFSGVEAAVSPEERVTVP
jgi:hypothetical protein